ncbi:MAG: hypothetical protein IJT95_07025, partial [Abditibacteriota bacterium]|nr:hypothetical protein [Abditibacteriota bacterium]
QMTVKGQQGSAQVANYNYTDSGHTILLANAVESPLKLGGGALKAGDTLSAAGFDPEKGKAVLTSVTLGEVKKDSAALTAPLEDFYCGGPVFRNDIIVGYVYEAGDAPVINITDPDDIAAGISECLENLLPRDHTDDSWDEDEEDPDTEQDPEEPKALELKGGQTVFGAWMDEPITWKVLAREEGRALLISDKALFYGKYHQYTQTIDELKRYREENGAYPPVKWEESSLCEYLNKDFYTQAFSPDQREYILEPAEEDYGGRVSLLSEAEAKGFWNRYDARICHPADYAKKQGAAANCPWWLRSEGMGDMRACAVTKDGKVEKNAMAGQNTATALAGVRPVIWVRIK